MTKLAELEEVRRQVVRTPYGEPSGALTVGRLRGREVMFLARHGYGHTIPPHAVNYRANIWALASQGVREIIAIASVGGIRADLGPGVLVVPSQIIDYTHDRASTYFDGADGVVKHVDFTHPYSSGLRAKLLRACAAAGEPVRDGGVYAAMQGPRLETAAEINRLERDGADMVGMTGMPEAAVANWAAGRADSRSGISLAEIGVVLEQALVRVRKILHFVEEADGSQASA